MPEVEHTAILAKMAEALQELMAVLRMSVSNIAIYNSHELAERALTRLEKLETQLAEIRDPLSRE